MAPSDPGIVVGLERLGRKRRNRTGAMMGFVRLILAALVGCIALVLLPRQGLLAATQELIAFLSLIMAGLLPAMILTATILRGGGLSARRIDEYGGALRVQLTFWATLFIAAAAATLGVVGAKVFSTPGSTFSYAVGSGFVLDPSSVTAAFIGLAGAGLGIVMQRLKAAFVGLNSLLDLNVKMAKTEAHSNDRSLLDALAEQANSAAVEKPYQFK